MCSGDSVQSFVLAQHWVRNPSAQHAAIQPPFKTRSTGLINLPKEPPRKLNLLNPWSTMQIPPVICPSPSYARYVRLPKSLQTSLPIFKKPSIYLTKQQ